MSTEKSETSDQPLPHPRKRHMELTPSGTQERDWNRVVDLKPEGYLELTDGVSVTHGPIESVTRNDDDCVVIKLKWVATMPAMGKPGFGRWKKVPDEKDKIVAIPNLLIPYIIEETPEKGPRVRFGMNILYINKIDGVDPAKVEGLRLD